MIAGIGWDLLSFVDITDPVYEGLCESIVTNLAVW